MLRILSSNLSTPLLLLGGQKAPPPLLLPSAASHGWRLIHGPSRRIHSHKVEEEEEEEEKKSSAGEGKQLFFGVCAYPEVLLQSCSTCYTSASCSSEYIINSNKDTVMTLCPHDTLRWRYKLPCSLARQIRELVTRW